MKSPDRPKLFYFVVARLRFALIRARHEGIIWTAKETLEHVLISAIWFLLLPFDVILYLLGFRRLPVITHRIGHLAAEIDCFLKEKQLGRLPARRWFIIVPQTQLANRCLLEYWKPLIFVITNPVAAKALNLCVRQIAVFHRLREYVLALNRSARYYEVNAAWGSRSPILSLTPGDMAFRDAAFRQLGIPENVWFVCIHARETGYYVRDDAIQVYRNFSIHDLVPAIREIHRRGGWCVRMGDPSGAPLDNLDGYIDYAHHPMRSDRMDVLLCASCRFFLGNTSGIYNVSTVFGVPCALANVTPITGLAYRPGDIAIPKLLWSKKELRYLSFSEAFKSPSANFRMVSQFERADIAVRNNSPVEILDLAVEMLDRLEGEEDKYIQYDDLQEAFMSLISANDYCFGSTSRIGSKFLEKYHHLLPT